MAARPGFFPLVWLFFAAAIAALCAVQPTPSGGVAPSEPTATYYVTTYAQFAVALPIALAFVAGAYLMLGVLRLRYRPRLAWLHLAFTLVGIGLMSTPVWTLRLATDFRRFRDPLRAFEAFNAISGVGYALLIAGSGIFLLLLGEALLRRARASRRAPAP